LYCRNLCDARGDASPDSDFDFLVIERAPQDQHTEMVRLGQALHPLGMPFDVVVVSERYAEDWGGVKGSMVHAALTTTTPLTPQL
jgi:predicted nucleotidyltransferase